MISGGGDRRKEGFEMTKFAGGPKLNCFAAKKLPAVFILEIIKRD